MRVVGKGVRRLGETLGRLVFAAGSCLGSVVVVCNEWTTVEDRELYVLSAISRKLENYPAFAAAFGSTCVRDCQQARIFMAFYAIYQRQHPRFDVNEPSR